MIAVEIQDEKGTPYRWRCRSTVATDECGVWRAAASEGWAAKAATRHLAEGHGVERDELRRTVPRLVAMAVEVWP